jgi:Cytochrome C oxidase, cbb3-type, subunit III
VAKAASELRPHLSGDFSVRSTIDQEFKGISISRTSVYGRKIGNALVWIGIVAVALPAFTGWAADQQSIVRGRELYLRYCAACHGNDADGRGPVAEDLKESPSDLRYLGERYGRPLPTPTIARFIDGRQDVAAHGPRDMPVWGRRFYDAWTAHQAGEEDLQTQIDEIVIYLNAIQRVPRRPESPRSPLTSR